MIASGRSGRRSARRPIGTDAASRPSSRSSIGRTRARPRRSRGRRAP
jgi:hypothetical protein